MRNMNSVLQMQKLVFDKIEFVRHGFKNDITLKLSIQVQIGTNENDEYKVTIVLKGTKEQEYSFEISLSGFFSIDENMIEEDIRIQELISKNAVAIMMPYLRSEVSLLTAQPDTECVVLPPFDINKMLSKESDRQM